MNDFHGYEITKTYTNLPQELKHMDCTSVPVSNNHGRVTPTGRDYENKLPLF